MANQAKSKESGSMLRQIASPIFLLTGVVIGLGAFGHDSNATKIAIAFARSPDLDAKTVSIVLAVWHFCSGCMLVFGALCIRTWWRAREGRADFLTTDLIGILYLVSGALTIGYTGLAFFWVFVGLGLALLISSLALRSRRVPT